MGKHSHLCSSSFSRESPHLRASSGVGLREKDSALAKRSHESRIRRPPRRSASETFPADKATPCAPPGPVPAPKSAPAPPRLCGKDTSAFRSGRKKIRYKEVCASSRAAGGV